MAGCCYGRPTHVPWAITFTNPAAAANVGTPLGVPLHPTQLYESAAEALILVLLLWTEKKGRPFEGRTFWSYLVLYGISRFVIEFFRGDERGVVFGTISTSQFISLMHRAGGHRHAPLPVAPDVASPVPASARVRRAS